MARKIKQTANQTDSTAVVDRADGEVDSAPASGAENVADDAGAKIDKNVISSLIFQAWAGVAVWMTFGLLMEGFIGYRIPSYLADPTRREMFRLAHAHGALLSLMLLGVAFTAARINAPAFAVWALRIGALLMPLGFLFAGLWHFKEEPGVAIWLVPVAALLVIFGAITMALASFNKKSE